MYVCVCVTYTFYRWNQRCQDAWVWGLDVINKNLSTGVQGESEDDASDTTVDEEEMELMKEVMNAIQA